MKKNVFFLTMAMFFIAPIFAQQQLPKIAFNGVELNLTQSQPGINTFNPLVQNAAQSYACYYDTNNNLVVRTVDNKVFDFDNNLVDSLFDNSLNNTQVLPDVIIVPKERNNNCELYIIYMTVTLNTNGLEYHKCYLATYDIGLRKITKRDLYSIGAGNYVTGGIAVSDFIGTTSNRSVYYLSNDGSYRSEPCTLNSFILSEQGIINIATMNYAFVPGEIELASNNAFLAITSISHSPGSLGQIRIIPLDANGYPSFPQIKYNVEPTASERFIGLEISADNNYIITNSAAGKFYKIDVSNINTISTIASFVPQTADINYTYSQIERGRDGRFYVVDGAGRIAYINSSFNGITTVASNLNTSAIITNQKYLNHPSTPTTYFLIPNQVDGSSYNYSITDRLVCCSAATNTPLINNMPGVTVAQNGLDIIILAPYNVVWTPTSNPFVVDDNRSDVYLDGNIIVQPGAKLSIYDMTIHFDAEKELILTAGNTVTPTTTGANLYLNNTTLTARDICHLQILWNGIDIIGSTNIDHLQIPFSNTIQPQLYMTNGATIEKAKIAVDASGGGLVRTVQNSKFINNETDVNIHNFNTQNYSSFYNTQFLTTDVLYSQKNRYPINHIRLRNVHGVGFFACFFANYASEIESPLQRGSGVFSEYSRFSVKAYNNNPSSFQNLLYGVKSIEGTAITIENTNFFQNIGGAWISGNNATSVTLCDFDVADNDFYPQTNFHAFGLYLESCTGYQIEENLFHDGVLGLVVYNSGTAENEIYLNDFQNLTGLANASGIIAIGNNARAKTPVIPSTGLQFICNQFTNTNYAMGVVSGSVITTNGLVNVTNSIIRQTQGWDYTFSIIRNTDNILNLLPGTLQQSDFYLCSNKYPYIYNSSLSTLTTRTELIKYHNSISPAYYGVFTTRQQCCPSRLGYQQKLADDITRFESLHSEETDIINKIDELTYGINELALLISAQTANQNNVAVVHNELMQASPYLNDTILISYLENNNVSDFSRAGVMVANSPLPEKVKEKVPDSDLPEQLKSYIDQFQMGINELEKAHVDLKTTRMSKQKILDNMLIASLHLTDTLSLNRIDQHMNAANNVFELNTKANYLLTQNRFNEALNIYNDILSFNTAELSNDEIHLIELNKTKASILSNPSATNTIVQNNLNLLYQYANNYETVEGSRARAILASAQYIELTPVTILPNEEGIGNKSATIQNNSKQNPTPETKPTAWFTVYPNPAADYLSIEFMSPAPTNSFVIYDSKGVAVFTSQNTPQIGFISVPVHHLQQGQYTIEFLPSKQTQNLIIQR